MSNAHDFENNPIHPVAKQAIDEFIKNTPSWQAKPKDDLQLLFDKFEQQGLRVMAEADKMAQEELVLGFVHSPVGRQKFTLDIHKMFVDQYSGYNKDELRFLLAWTQTLMLVSKYV